MFDINDIIDVRVEQVQGSSIYYIDNFFNEPEKIVDYLKNTPCPLWKGNERPSNNGVQFEDRRHHIADESITYIQTMLSELSGDQIYPESNGKDIFSNCCFFKNSSFNDYKNNFWNPHKDGGYTAIIYLNKDSGPGTNLYETVEPDVNKMPEHWEPWRQRSKYKVIKTIESVYNRLVLFDGKKFLHGMAIEDDRFFHEERLNVVLFLKGN